MRVQTVTCNFSNRKPLAAHHTLLLVLHLLYWFVVQKLLVRLYYKVSQLFLMFSRHPAALFKLFLTDSTDLFYSMHFLNNFMVPLCFLFCLDLSLLCSCIHLASELFFSLSTIPYASRIHPGHIPDDPLCLYLPRHTQNTQ